MSALAPVPASPLQRLRLISLGFPAHHGMTADWADESLAAAVDLESDGPSERQTTLAESLGVAVEPGDTRGSLGDRVYQTYLALAWVFSVWREATGETSAVWSGLSLPRTRALAVARELIERGQLDGLRIVPSGPDDSDLYCEAGVAALHAEARPATLRALGLRPSGVRRWSFLRLFALGVAVAAVV